MPLSLTTGQAAEMLAERLTIESRTPNVTARTVAMLSRAQLLKDVGEGKQVRVNYEEVVDLAARTRYITDPRDIDTPLFRVSVIASFPSVVKDLDGTELRTTAGVDYTRRDQLGGFEGVWKISDTNADDLVERQVTMLATCRGYVAPEHVRTIVGWKRCRETSRKYLVTEPARPAVADVIGTGIWIDVPPGRESDFLTR